MLRLAANLTFLFTELPMLDRFGAAARAGFRGAEILFPYDLAAPELAQAAQAADIEFVLMNTPPPNWAGGPRGFAAVPGGEDRFRRDFDRALRYAQVLRARHIHVMAGVSEGPTARQTFLDNLAWACDRAPHASLTIEPLNPLDMPGYFLADFDAAAEVLDTLDRPNLGLQFDAYHAHLITGDATACLRAHAARVRHVQIAGVGPAGRVEPSAAPIDYPAFLRTLADGGYTGWVSAEYVPATVTTAGLGWMAALPA